MQRRYVSLWFPYLLADWYCLRRPALAGKPLVLVAASQNRRQVTALNAEAAAQGIRVGMPEADAKAMAPGLNVLDEPPGKALRLLRNLGAWCIRYSPVVGVDGADGLLIDATGCAHLWGGERGYYKEIVSRLRGKGYQVRAAIAGTMGTAVAVARYAQQQPIVESGQEAEALKGLPPAALRPEPQVNERLHKLGLKRIGQFMGLQRSVLRRRFGEPLLLSLARALGQEAEYLEPIFPPEPWLSRLPCPDPVRTAEGIEIAIRRLLQELCARLEQEGRGIRTAVLKGYRVDGKTIEAQIGTSRPTFHTGHLFRLFQLKITGIEPALGIELFTLEAAKTEDMPRHQEALWAAQPGLEDQNLAELLDRLAVKTGPQAIQRFLPAEHYWPERSLRRAGSLTEKAATSWRTDRPRPTRLLAQPVRIEVTAPIPDYPPMLFRVDGQTHKVRRADGPERIEREWWMDEGEHRDYYCVEDEQGRRYWLFRSGHYHQNHQRQWYLHGYFA